MAKGDEEQKRAIEIAVTAEYSRMGAELGAKAAATHRAAGLPFGLDERITFRKMLDDAIAVGFGSRASPTQLEAYKAAFWMALNDGLKAP